MAVRWAIKTKCRSSSTQSNDLHTRHTACLSYLGEHRLPTVVMLTDLRDSWVFFWLEGQCIWHSAQDRPAAAGILEDMLQQEELNNSEVQTLPKEDCDRLGIYKRQILDPNAVGHKDQRDTSLADTIDSLSAEEAAITKVQYMFDLFNQISGVPMPDRMGPRPVCPILGMYM